MKTHIRTDKQPQRQKKVEKPTIIIAAVNDERDEIANFAERLPLKHPLGKGGSRNGYQLICQSEECCRRALARLGLEATGTEDFTPKTFENRFFEVPHHTVFIVTTTTTRKLLGKPLDPGDIYLVQNFEGKVGPRLPL